MRKEGTRHARTCILERPDPSVAGLDPDQGLSGDAVRPGISFHQIHEPSGKRIRYEKVAPGVGPVDRDEIIKGFDVSKGSYVLLDEEEIEAVKIESRKTLELVQFADARRDRRALLREAIPS